MPTNELRPEIKSLFGNRWWTLALRGFVAILFGMLAFRWPGVTAATLVTLFGFYVLADGVFSLVSSIGDRRSRENRWLLALEGVVGLWAGVVMLRAPFLTATVLVFFIAMWAMITGFLRIVAAFRLRKEISGEMLLALSGLLSVLFALMLVFRPGVSMLGLVWVIAGYAVVLGIVLLMLAFELRQNQRIALH